jgi:hypothetical protein
MSSYLLLSDGRMVFVRATIVIDELLAHRVRQAYAGNLSKGVNELLREHLNEGAADAPFFGCLRGKGMLAELKHMRKEEREADARDPLLCR